MAKEIIFDEEVQNKLRQGADIMARAIRATYGPRGHNVVLGKASPGMGMPATPPRSTSDGNSVAKHIGVQDRFVNMGVSLIREAATSTAFDAQDGSTTAAVLAHAMVTEGIKRLAAGASAIALKHGIEKAAACIDAELKRASIRITTTQQLVQVASVAGHDAEIGRVIVETAESVGKNGVVNVEPGQALGLEIECVEGARFDQGYLSPYFINRRDKQDVVIDQPYILITDKKISALSDLLPVLEVITPISKNMVIICGGLEGEALSTLVANNLKGNIRVLAVKAPGFGEYSQDMMGDLAIITGGEFISSDKGRDLGSVTIHDLGRARSVTANKDSTVIIKGQGNQAAIDARVRQLVAQVNSLSEKFVTTQEYKTKRLEERLARLSGGVAIIRVGAPTSSEQQESLIRVRGALAATKAAAQEGILPGGGVAFIDAAAALDKLSLTGDELSGVDVVRHALEEPIRQLVSNASYNSNVVLEAIRRSKPGTGFDVVSETYGDMQEKGIIDAARVVRTAFLNAASIGALVLVTEALIADRPENTEAQKKHRGK